MIDFVDQIFDGKPFVWIESENLKDGMVACGNRALHLSARRWSNAPLYKITIIGTKINGDALDSKGVSYQRAPVLLSYYNEKLEYAVMVYSLPNAATSNHVVPSSKKISDYPKTCEICRSPAYLGLNEIEHEPGSKGHKEKCKGLVLT